VLGRVKIGDKLRVQRVNDGQMYFPDRGVSASITASDLDTAPRSVVYTVRVPAETDRSTVPAQRWPVRDVDLRVPDPCNRPVEGEVLGVRLVRRG